MTINLQRRMIVVRQCSECPHWVLDWTPTHDDGTWDHRRQCRLSGLSQPDMAIIPEWCPLPARDDK